MAENGRSNIAFIGTGWIGLNRMTSLLKENIINPVAILDPDVHNVQKAIDLAPGARMVNVIDELFENKPDGIVIATPSALHASQCRKVLEHGIPVFCQKPLARTAAECQQVISAALKANMLLGVDFSYRHTNGMQKIHAISGELGDIFAVDLVFNNAYGPDKMWFYDPKLSGGGCLIDLGVHLIDLALWILNFPGITNVSAVMTSKGKIIRKEDPETVEDYVSAQIVTDRGTLIRLACSWNLPAGQDAEIHAYFYGTNGAALFYNVNGSFYDFEAALCHGTSRRIISQPPDDWGGRALIEWAKTLNESKDFKDSAFEYYITAETIDRIYGRNGA
jgi:predicted dehydrogenase